MHKIIFTNIIMQRKFIERMFRLSMLNKNYLTLNHKYYLVLNTVFLESVNKCQVNVCIVQ